MEAHTKTPSRQPVDDRARWLRYEDLKALYTATAESQIPDQVYIGK